MPDDDMIELIAPGGCDEANHGTERYRVDNNGRVRVSREAAHWLVRTAGFRHAPPPPDVPVTYGTDRVPVDLRSYEDFGKATEMPDTTDPRRKRSAR